MAITIQLTLTEVELQALREWARDEQQWHHEQGRAGWRVSSKVETAILFGKRHPQRGETVKGR